MKAAMTFIAIFALMLLIVPMIALNFRVATPAKEKIPVHTPGAAAQVDAVLPASSSESSSKELPEQSQPEKEEPKKSTAASAETFRILNQTTGAVEEVSLRDYVRGAVAAEMPALFHTEALKAQAVAAHTFALNQRLTQQKNPDPALMGADFAADPINRKIYITEAQAKEFYGDGFDVYWKKVCEAADSVVSYVLEYDGEPIVAAYHAMSAGLTESAENVWVNGAPYLVQVESEGDYYAPDYHTEKKLSKAKTAEVLSAGFAGFDPKADPQEWFSDIERSDSGYVTAVTIGGEQYHGKDLRTAFDLRSHNIDITYADGTFTFDVYGYGHGVGLSQYGADFLARQGYTFDKILEHYYADTVLMRIE
ncbi:stage II sporulation protein D [Oscillospiraceae bacterium MB08-C2-2]|nr:stage II sporulation protein D [Oscillospiraceae bacterium MB08-C2-2]